MLTGRRAVVGLLATGLVGLAVAAFYRPFPSDRTLEGAYVRIAKGIMDGRVEDVFPYLETDAQWACFTIRDARRSARERVRTSYPDSTEQKAELIGAYAAEADAPDGPDVFALIAKRRSWDKRLRRDLSGVSRIEVQGERGTVLTARGTRYPFRRRENGIWGLTIFTADLLAEKDRAARDLSVIEAAARDYERAGSR